jgi:hypothetical protein
MTLEVIGAGFGRTGTLSLKVALEQLGYTKCHHMMEVMGSPTQPGLWHRLVDGGAPDWDAIFDGYRATVDWPACAWWRELAERYPDAKVILSLRDANGWYDSVMNTIYHALVAQIPDTAPEQFKTQMSMVRKLVGEQTFGGRIEDRAHAIAVFDRHNQQVIDTIPKERLLVYRPGDGWEPICRFLDRPIPESDFPRLNDTAEFRARLGLPPVANS